MASMPRSALIRNPSVEGPLRLTLLPLFAIAGLVLGLVRLALRPEEKGWVDQLVRAAIRAPAAPAPRKTPRRARSSDSRRAAALAPGGRGGRTAAPDRAASRKGDDGQVPAPACRRASRSATIMSCPRIDLLDAPPPAGRSARSTAPASSAMRACSKSVLEDFHVRGDIVEVRPGPVVTMYELEPASGIKASRVISWPTTSRATCRRCRRASRPSRAEA